MWYIVVLLVVIIIAILFMPKPKTSEPSKQDFEATTASEGEAIPVVFGTVDISAPNLVWYGDVTVTAIRKKSGGK